MFSILWDDPFEDTYFDVLEYTVSTYAAGEGSGISTEGSSGGSTGGTTGVLYSTEFWDSVDNGLWGAFTIGEEDYEVEFQRDEIMYVQVDAMSTLRRKVITIPDLAIIYSGNRNYVFVSLGDGDFELRPITVFTRSEGKAVISQGLRKDELVVSNGQFLLDSEASLKEALQKGKMNDHQY